MMVAEELEDSGLDRTEKELRRQVRGLLLEVEAREQVRDEERKALLKAREEAEERERGKSRRGRRRSGSKRTLPSSGTRRAASGSRRAAASGSRRALARSGSRRRAAAPSGSRRVSGQHRGRGARASGDSSTAVLALVAFGVVLVISLGLLAKVM